jgi:hypothetical protein
MKIVLLLRAAHRDPTSGSEVLPWLGPCDGAALATALALKGPEDTLVAVTAGPPSDEICLELALRAGVPRAIRIWDRCLEDADLRTLCGLMAGGIYRLGYDLVLAGHRSADWGSGALGPALAHFLGVPHVTGVIRAELQERHLRVEHLRDDDVVSLAMQIPALLAIAEGPACARAEVTEHPPVEELNLEDTTLRIPRLPDAGPGPLQPVGEHHPTFLQSATSLLLELKNSGLVR